jgi:topoisomerase IV subunit B
MTDLFRQNTALKSDYSAKDIEVLEGLEPVRKRPGMYIGGTDDKAMHHLVAEVLDNAMDEAVAGHANRIEVRLEEGNFVTIRDNGRGIPVDPHPKFPDLSALEVIFTTLHSGGKFTDSVYATAGGLHGVGISVVNALSELVEVEVARSRQVWRQTYSQGKSTSPLVLLDGTFNRRGTLIRFKPDPEIFGDHQFKAHTLYNMIRAKAYLFKGVEINWWCHPSLIKDDKKVPQEAKLHYLG